MRFPLYLVNHLIPLLAVITNIVTIANATVHKIPTRLHRLPANLAKQRLEQRYAEHQETIKILSSQNSAKNGTLPFLASGIIQVANISVGTPPQLFLVEIDWSWEKDMALIDSNATSRYNETANDELHLYNASASSTFSSEYGYYGGHFSNGYEGQDLVRFKGQDLQLTFGIMNNVNFHYFNEYGIDGVFGLSPTKHEHSDGNNATNIIAQIESQLDKPIVTVWTNSSHVGEGNGQITLGALDTDHCQSNWIFMPKVEPYYYYSGWSVYMTTMHGTWPNGTEQNFEANRNVTIAPYISGIYVPDEWIPLLLNVSKAVYDNETYMYLVDCDTSKLDNVTFHIGGVPRGHRGNKSMTYNLTITVADYTNYEEYFDVCYFDAYGFSTAPYAYSGDRMEIVLGNNFVLNHCLAYNLLNNRIGFADSKTPKTFFAEVDYYVYDY